jgi:type IV secretory pathway VirB10-like protein
MRRLLLPISFAFAAFAATSCGDDAPPPPQQSQQAPVSDSDLFSIPEEEKIEEPVEEIKSMAPLASERRIDFGEQLDFSRKERTLTFTNPGKIKTPMAQYLRAPTSAEFNITGPCLVTSELEPGQGCLLTVVFQPSSHNNFSDRLEFNHPDLQSPLVIRLTGKVQKPPEQKKGPSAQQQFAAQIRAQSQVAPIYVHSGQAEGAIRVRETTQNDWQLQGWERNVASLPIPMDKVILRQTPIAATLVETIDTHMGCPARAVVSRHVWGHTPGVAPLIPKGSMLEGKCASVGGTTQSRLAVFWDRLITPNGRAISLAAPSAGPDGRGGVMGTVNDYFWERYARQFLLSVINAGFVYSASDDQTTTTTAAGDTTVTETPKSQAIERLSQDVQVLTNQLAAEAQNYLPRIIVPKGTSIIVYPERDIWFDEYRIVAVSPGLVDEHNLRNGSPVVTNVPGAQEMRPLNTIAYDPEEDERNQTNAASTPNGAANASREPPSPSLFATPSQTSYPAQYGGSNTAGRAQPSTLASGANGASPYPSSGSGASPYPTPPRSNLPQGVPNSGGSAPSGLIYPVGR